MLSRRLYVKINRKARKIYSFILLVMVFLFNGCASHKGDLTFNEVHNGDSFNISGRIVLDEIVETDSARLALAKLTDLSCFRVTAHETSAQSDKYGYYSLKHVPFSDSLVLEAKANKIKLLRRVTADELCYSDLSSLEINLETTAEALVYQQGLFINKNLTPADIRAREYSEDIASIIQAIKLVMQLPKDSINKSTLDLPAVTSAANTLAQKCLDRDSNIKDANTVLRHGFLRNDFSIVQLYLSPAFTNDYTNFKNWAEATNYYQELFKNHSFEQLTWEILDTELIENNSARVRTKIGARVINNISEEVICDETWTFDAYWRQEGSIWKLYQNLPLYVGDPNN